VSSPAEVGGIKQLRFAQLPHARFAARLREREIRPGGPSALCASE
jgi:hypothetical protein